MRRSALRPLASALLLALPVLAFAQGALTPSAAPAPTMKSLDQIEPRTPLGQVGGSTSSIVISVPGSYVLLGNLTVATGAGITVNASDVTLDLGGFTVSSTQSPSDNAAIGVGPSMHHITVRNGHLHSGSSIAYKNGVPSFVHGAGFAAGVATPYGTTDLCLEDLEIDGIDGPATQTNYVTTVARRCLVSTCLIGIGVASVEDCRVTLTLSDAIACTTASNSSGNSIAGAGISTATAINCRGSSISGIGLDTMTATDCTGESTTGIGLRAEAATNCKGLSAGASPGLTCTTAVGCMGENQASGTGLSASSAADCVGSSRSGTGLFADNATNCRGTSSSGTGLDTNSDLNGYTGTATGCTGISLLGHGLIASIANNCTGRTTASNKIGIWVSGTATGCRGTNTGTSGIGSQSSAISCTIAVACTATAGTIDAGSKQLGTP